MGLWTWQSRPPEEARGQRSSCSKWTRERVGPGSQGPSGPGSQGPSGPWGKPGPSGPGGYGPGAFTMGGLWTWQSKGLEEQNAAAAASASGPGGVLEELSAAAARLQQVGRRIWTRKSRTLDLESHGPSGPEDTDPGGDTSGNGGFYGYWPSQQSRSGGAKAQQHCSKWAWRIWDQERSRAIWTWEAQDLWTWRSRARESAAAGLCSKWTWRIWTRKSRTPYGPGSQGTILDLEAKGIWDLEGYGNWSILDWRLRTLAVQGGPGGASSAAGHSCASGPGGYGPGSQRAFLTWRKPRTILRTWRIWTYGSRMVLVELEDYGHGLVSQSGPWRSKPQPQQRRA
ncbi:hypothetical protein HNY73_014703 [Argiope bruennichi]|uniref:Uncharacterized protein n=1 Tax=Argiope bruennichi TaxID=94029 RepID=A0A8T0EPU9_ARGBR|nr:hypothetical protein HNY73_014703 [Argiope bruennichi]